MREIKFRIWDKELKRMSIVTEMVCDPNGIPIDANASILGEEAILMQFTGLKDENGQEIWEGDICELEVLRYDTMNPSFEDEGEHTRHTGIVHFIPSRGFHLRVKKSWDIENEESVIAPKVKDIVQYRTKKIGNIWENPDLIK